MNTPYAFFCFFLLQRTQTWVKSHISASIIYFRTNIILFLAHTISASHRRNDCFLFTHATSRGPLFSMSASERHTERRDEARGKVPRRRTGPFSFRAAANGAGEAGEAGDGAEERGSERKQKLTLCDYKLTLTTKFSEKITTDSCVNKTNDTLAFVKYLNFRTLCNHSVYYSAEHKCHIHVDMRICRSALPFVGEEAGEKCRHSPNLIQIIVYEVYLSLIVPIFCAQCFQLTRPRKRERARTHTRSHSRHKMATHKMTVEQTF